MWKTFVRVPRKRFQVPPDIPLLPFEVPEISNSARLRLVGLPGWVTPDHIANLVFKNFKLAQPVPVYESTGSRIADFRSSIEILKGDQSRGQAFVAFESLDEAIQAKEYTHGKWFDSGTQFFQPQCYYDFRGPQIVDINEKSNDKLTAPMLRNQMLARMTGHKDARGTTAAILDPQHKILARPGSRAFRRILQEKQQRLSGRFHKAPFSFPESHRDPLHKFNGHSMQN